jgi:hypothetical protein
MSESGLDMVRQAYWTGGGAGKRGGSGALVEHRL